MRLAGPTFQHQVERAITHMYNYTREDIYGEKLNTIGTIGCAHMALSPRGLGWPGAFDQGTASASVQI